MPLTKRFTVEQIKAALLQCGTYTAAAKWLNCSSRTVSNYVRDCQELKEAARQGRAALTDRAESNIASAILAGSERASRWWLQSSPEGKQRGYGTRTEVAPAVLINPEDYAPHRPASWAEAREVYADIENVLLEPTEEGSRDWTVLLEGKGA